MSMDPAGCATPFTSPVCICRECGGPCTLVAFEDNQRICNRCCFPSRHLSRLVLASNLLGEFYSSPAEITEWMHAAQPLLAGRRPTDLLRTDAGAAEVMALIQQLLDGVHL